MARSDPSARHPRTRKILACNTFQPPKRLRRTGEIINQQNFGWAYAEPRSRIVSKVICFAVFFLLVYFGLFVVFCWGVNISVDTCNSFF